MLICLSKRSFVHIVVNHTGLLAPQLALGPQAGMKPAAEPMGRRQGEEKPTMKQPEARLFPQNVHVIRSLHRGLTVLELLNQHNGAGVSELARLSGIPRSTTYRILENLCLAGYVRRDTESDTYVLTVKVGRLSEGFNDEAWIRQIARPLLRALGQDVVWPVCLLTAHGTAMVVRESTDAESALALDTYLPGTEVPLLTSASGLVYLAHCPPQRREALIEVLAASADQRDNLARNARLLNRLLSRTRAEGYALNLRNPRTKSPGKISTIAVPVVTAERFIGSLAMHYIDSALSPAEVVTRYLDRLSRTARRIGTALEDAPGKTLER